ncbi:MAG: hypothetical protein ABIZ81_15685 [Opitutaceae bacterium]
MITSRRDYLLRMIDEVGRLLARVIFKHQNGRQQEALQLVVEGCERLFNLEASQLFQFTPPQHFLMLTRDESPEDGRDKVLLYAALNAEAGRVYLAMNNPDMARNSFLNSLRFSLRAQKELPRENLPDYAPKIPELLEALQGQPLDTETEALLKESADA